MQSCGRESTKGRVAATCAGCGKCVSVCVCVRACAGVASCICARMHMQRQRPSSPIMPLVLCPLCCALVCCAPCAVPLCAVPLVLCPCVLCPCVLCPLCCALVCYAPCVVPLVLSPSWQNLLQGLRLNPGQQQQQRYRHRYFRRRPAEPPPPLGGPFAAYSGNLSPAEVPSCSKRGTSAVCSRATQQRTIMMSIQLSIVAVRSSSSSALPKLKKLVWGLIPTLHATSPNRDTPAQREKEHTRDVVAGLLAHVSPSCEHTYSAWSSVGCGTASHMVITAARQCKQHNRRRNRAGAVQATGDTGS
eukprot:355308-Chlamydomonas_euryale.AAC.3